MGLKVTCMAMGAKAALNGLGEDDCPYRRPSAARALWLQGFRQETTAMDDWLDEHEPGWREALKIHESRSANLEI